MEIIKIVKYEFHFKSISEIYLILSNKSKTKAQVSFKTLINKKKNVFRLHFICLNHKNIGQIDFLVVFKRNIFF